MGIFIGYASAHEFWRQADDGWRAFADSGRMGSLYRTNTVAMKRKPTLADVEKALEMKCFSDPLHIMVPNGKTRLRCKGVACHVCQGAYPYGAFIPLAEGVRIASPALAFVQMANSLSVSDLVVMGMELCGQYAVSCEGFITPRRALANVAQLRSFVERAQGRWGSCKARRALRFLMDGSASPMETALALLLSMPLSLGGYGLPKPMMNLRIDAAEFGGHMMGSTGGSCFFRGDLCWPKAKLCVEYDSDAHHTGSDRIAHDSWRRSELGLTGFTVITVTKAQLYSREALDRTVRLLAHELGIRIRKRDAGYEERQRALRETLLYKKQAW